MSVAWRDGYWNLTENMLRHILVVLLASTAYADMEYYDDPNAEPGAEYGDKFEGDMLLYPQQEQELYEETQSDSVTANSNGLRNTAYRWPENTVVYEIQQNAFSSDQLSRIYAAMEDISQNSCIRFRERRSQGEHVVFIRADSYGCFAHVGYTGSQYPGYQSINLGRGCFHHGTIVHEMLHTLGFYHMQSAYDRDEYVRILWQNIQSGQEHNFNKYNNRQVMEFGVPYDYKSVMHYTDRAFSANGMKTIEALREDVSLGQRIGMTQSDIIKLNRMYCQ